MRGIVVCVKKVLLVHEEEEKEEMGGMRFERMTFGSGDQRSIQLS